MGKNLNSDNYITLLAFQGIACYLFLRLSYFFSWPLKKYSVFCTTLQHVVREIDLFIRLSLSLYFIL